MMNRKETRSSKVGACLVITLAMVVSLVPMPAGAAPQTTDAHIASFTASPSYVNLNRTTTVTMTVSSLYGGGNDNYKVTVYAPDGSVVASDWFNFTAVGSISKTLGNTTVDFKAAITKVGAYLIEATHGSAIAASIPLQTTDKLLVVTEFAAASNPWTDIHNCPIAEEFQRGDEVIARAYVRYLSTGEILNGTLVPTAPKNVTGTLFEETKVINYNAQGFWRAAWFIPWDKPLGTYSFTVAASDGMGNSGTGVSPKAGVYGALKILASILPTTVSTTNASSGAISNAFYPGESVGIVARSVYDLHFAHNFEYTKTNRTLAGTPAKPGPGQDYALGTDRGGVVQAAIGSGAFNATAGTFADQLAKVDLVFNEATGNWMGAWTVPTDSVLTGDILVRVTARDGAPTGNSGSGTTSITTLERPLPVKETQYVNQTVEVEKLKDGALDGPVAYGLMGVTLAGGLGVGYVLSRGKLSGGKKGGPGEKGGDEWQ
ncbi:MAG: hypothetical protein HY556_03865 [Euryarchaeota archaeon]|nr:hypothetical protein [Euryarchaeota archaeon]